MQERCIGKQYLAIKNLPDNPTKPILWIVYNEDMVEHTRCVIESIRGSDYMKNVIVTSRANSSKHRGTVYFDPLLYELLGNGNG